METERLEEIREMYAFWVKQDANPLCSVATTERCLLEAIRELLDEIDQKDDEAFHRGVDADYGF